jgi:hypothetical protein
MRDSLTGHLRFERLARVAKLVLTLPHSNADEERGFSFIKMNKTPVRNALKLNETTLTWNSLLRTLLYSQGTVY